MSVPHVLVINIFFAPFTYGGATVVAEQVAKSLVQRQKCKVTAVSVTSRSDLTPYSILRTERDGIVNFVINLPAHRSYVEIYDNPQISEIIADLVEQLEPDVVHAHCLQDIGVGVLTTISEMNIPIVLSIHDFWWVCERQFMIRPDQTYCGQDPIVIDNCRSCVDHFPATRIRNKVLRRHSDLAAVVTYPSTFTKNLCEASGLAAGKGVVWENGVQQPGVDFFEKQAERRAADPRIAFGYLGGPSQIKGWPMIQSAFASLEREDFKGYLVDGSLDGNWWAPDATDKLKGSWTIHPGYTQTDMDDFYAKIDVLLFMSQWKETFGLAIREAVARGIKVIQTDSGGTTEHPAVVPEELIAIGAGPGELKKRVNSILENGSFITKPLTVRAFDQQADHFMEIISPALAKNT